MSRAKRPTADIGPHDAEVRELAAFFRGLAACLESDPELAAAVRAALDESGLLASAQRLEMSAARPKRTRASAARAARAEAPVDPFVLYREHGEVGLREALAALDVASLRAIVRAHRLDPARISARWSTPERLIALIAQQVQARANIGRAFAQV